MKSKEHYIQLEAYKRYIYKILPQYLNIQLSTILSIVRKLELHHTTLELKLSTTA